MSSRIETGRVRAFAIAPLVIAVAGCAGNVSREDATAIGSTASAMTALPVTAPAGTVVATGAIVVGNGPNCLFASGMNDLGAIAQYECLGSADQTFQFQSSGDGSSFFIVSSNSQKCVNVDGGSTADLATIIQYDCQGSSNERFVPTLNSDGTYQLAAMNSGKCLNVPNLGAVVQLDQVTCNGSANQKFTIRQPVSVVSGDSQSVPELMPTGPDALAMATFAPLSVKIVDASGNPLSGVQVNWSSTAPAGGVTQLEPSGGSTAVTPTDANGIATLNHMGGASAETYYAVGAFTVTATYGSSTATFHLTATALQQAQQLYTATIVSGDGQSVARSGTSVPGGIATFAPLSVKVVNASGAPAAGVNVLFDGSNNGAMAVSLDPSGSASERVATDSNGMATVSFFDAYYQQGAFAVTVNVGTDVGQCPPVTFHETVAASPPPPPPVAGGTMALVSGDSQSVPELMPTGPDALAMATFAPLSVKIVDASGNPLSGVQVNWSSTAPAGGVTQLEPSGGSTAVTPTDANGIATLNHMGGASAETYYAVGAFTVTATYGSSTATFHLTATALQQAQQLYTATIVSGDGQSVARSGTSVPGGIATFAPLSVKVVNASGAPAAGVNVLFDGSNNGAMAVSLDPSGSASERVATDSNGMATVSFFDAYYQQGAFAVTVNVGTDVGQCPPVTFHETVSQ